MLPEILKPLEFSFIVNLLTDMLIVQLRKFLSMFNTSGKFQYIYCL